MRPRVSLLLALSVLGSCNSTEKTEADAPPVLAFTTAPLRLIAANDTVRIVAELARSREQQTLGLMERRHLADSAGMLFTYAADQPETAAFWMFRTRIPLDIAFVDSAGVIRSIQHMVPCPTDFAQGCPSYPPGVSYRAALEANAGYFARHRIAVGGRLVLSDTVTSR